MADVAKLAGVSNQTVSRVINDSDHVASRTRERVMRAMDMLDYRPNSLARALVTGRSRTIGVVSFDTTLYGPASTLFGIERAAHEEDYFTSIVSVLSLDRPAVLDAVARLRAQGVEGILVIAPQVTTVRALPHVPADFPIVAVEAGEGAVPAVAVDQFAGAAAATRHLLELGPPHGAPHRRPARLAGVARADRRLARGAGGGRRDRRRAGGRGLERPLRLRARAPAAGRSGGDRRVRGERPHGARVPAAPARGRARRARAT